MDSDGTVNFIYDGAGILMETNQSGQILGAYTNGLMGAISKRNATNDYGYLMKDALGTTRNIVDAEQVIKMTYKYDIFGAIREATGQDPIGIPQTFTGKELDDDSGLHYFGARFYDSSLGRFITADTWTVGPDDARALHCETLVTLIARIGATVSASANLYLYCQNNCLALVDPTGHYSEHTERMQALIWAGGSSVLFLMSYLVGKGMLVGGAAAAGIIPLTIAVASFAMGVVGMYGSAMAFATIILLEYDNMSEKERLLAAGWMSFLFLLFTGIGKATLDPIVISWAAFYGMLSAWLDITLCFS